MHYYQAIGCVNKFILFIGKSKLIKPFRSNNSIFPFNESLNTIKRISRIPKLIIFGLIWSISIKGCFRKFFTSNLNLKPQKIEKWIIYHKRNKIKECSRF